MQVDLTNKELDQIVVLLGELTKEFYILEITPSEKIFDMIFGSINQICLNTVTLLNLGNLTIHKNKFKQKMENRDCYFLELNKELKLVFDFKFYICYLECDNTNFIRKWAIEINNINNIRTPKIYEDNLKTS